MPLFEVDLVNDIMKPLEPRIYPAEITGFQLKKDKNDSDMVVWQMSVIEPGENYGRELYYNTNLSNNVRLPNGEINQNARKRSNYYMQQFYNTIKAPYSAKGFATEDAVHCKCRVDVTQETFDGRIVNRVNAVLPYES